MNGKRLLCLLLIFSFLCGCTMAPKYERPEAPVPAQWPAGKAYPPAENAAAEKTAPLPWRDFIPDARLQEIIQTALANNRDLRLAVLTVEKARAYYGIGRVSLLPTVNAAGTWYQERIPADLSASGNAYTAEKYSVNLGITSWELDFFGRIRSLRDAALEEYMASREALRGAEVLLVSTVAQAYLALAADREAQQQVLKTLTAQEESYRLIRKRYEVGMVSELDLKRSQSQVDAARGDVARYTQLVAQDLNALNLLAGSPVAQDLLPENLSSVGPPRDISAGLSSEPLLARPDVLAAEHRLRAANANIGAARAAFFPRIALSTSVGTASAELSGLFKSGSGVWSFTPQITMPIFDARTWYAYDVAKLEKEISIAQYEKSIQTAFREVSDTLAEKGMINERIAAQESLVEALATAYRLSESRYNKGIDSYLTVLDAQRSLYAAEQGLILLKLVRINNRITLYKTLGGAVQ
ncbi:MAG: efflux transporter outer membrane subunit [Deltaproteobacteria bacterium]|nr:efflux transporter outer membrane subunit [Deltaproteobacteria bacterium]